MNFTSKFDLYFNRVGLKDLKARADFMGVSFESARKYFNEGTTPDDLRIVDTAKKLGLSEAEIGELLSLAQENRVERKKMQRVAREATLKSLTESTRESRNSSDIKETPPKNGTSSSRFSPSGIDCIPMKVVRILRKGVTCLKDVAEEDFEEHTVNVIAEHVKGKECFVLRVHNDQMAPTIISGDAVLIDQSLEYQNGNIVAVQDIGEDGFSMARFEQSGGVVTLSHDNLGVRPVSFGVFDPKRRYQILGRVARLVDRASNRLVTRGGGQEGRPNSLVLPKTPNRRLWSEDRIRNHDNTQTLAKRILAARHSRCNP